MYVRFVEGATTPINTGVRPRVIDLNEKYV